VLGGAFYRPGGLGQGCPGGGRRRVFWRRARAKPGTAALGACWSGLVAASELCGSALARPRRSASCREKRDREGGPSGVFLLLPCRTAWVGAEGAGLDSGGLLEHGYMIKTNGNRVGHSSSDFLDFCPPGVRHNARKNLNFEFLKTATVVGQDTSQGFQIYFC
jgi:hypothetical protein